MSNKIKIHKNRTNTIDVDLGIDITGDTLTSEIRTGSNSDSLLIATFTVTVTNATLGLLTLTLDNSVTDITVDSGFMDIKRLSAGEPLAVFDKPLEVEFQETVTL